MKSLTIILTTARREPHYEWFIESLLRQNADMDTIKVIAVDLIAEERWRPVPPWFHIVHPKPSVWYGKHRLTLHNWWGKASFINTGLCLADTEFIACVDDRCVLMPGFFTAIKDAMNGNYAVAGSYEKRINMKVEGGVITDPGTLTGQDSRNKKNRIRDAVNMYGYWWFGCCNALPLKWALQVGGYDESCDSLGYEDSIFGHILTRNNFITKYDPRMKIVEDRTMPEGELLVKRTDKGVSPKDKSHALETRTGGKKTATHDFDIRHVRSIVQSGGEFPVPTTPTHDWYDGQPLKEFGV